MNWGTFISRAGDTRLQQALDPRSEERARSLARALALDPTGFGNLRVCRRGSG
jgi:hypothetical protein